MSKVESALSKVESEHLGNYLLALVPKQEIWLEDEVFDVANISLYYVCEANSADQVNGHRNPELNSGPTLSCCFGTCIMSLLY